MAKSHAIVYAISNESPADLEKMRAAEHLGRDFVFLSDPQGKLASLYAGKYPEGYLKPATIVVGKGRTIVFASALENYRIRPAADAVLGAVRQYSSKPVKK